MHLQKPNYSLGFDCCLQTIPAPVEKIRIVEDRLNTDTVSSEKKSVSESQSVLDDLDSPALRLKRYREQAYRAASLDIASECTRATAISYRNTEETFGVLEHAVSNLFNIDSQVRSSL